MLTLGSRCLNAFPPSASVRLAFHPTFAWFTLLFFGWETFANTLHPLNTFPPVATQRHTLSVSFARLTLTDEALVHRFERLVRAFLCPTFTCDALRSSLA